VSLRGFSTISYWADDVAEAAAWYTDFLGVEPYFNQPAPDGKPAYVEFRIGDYQAELGIIDRRYAPPGAPRRTNRSPGAVTLGSSPRLWSTRSETCSA